MCSAWKYFQILWFLTYDEGIHNVLGYHEVVKIRQNLTTRVQESGRIQVWAVFTPKVLHSLQWAVLRS